MESDDATVAGIAAHVEEHVASIEAGRVVARDEIPHHHAVALHDHDVLVPLHPSMGWTEEICVEIFVGFVYVAHVRAYAVAQSADVVERVVSEAVAACFDHLEDVGVFAYVVAHHEKRGLHAIVVKHVKHPGRYFGYGAVVEGEIHGVLFGFYAPKGSWVEPA